MLGDFSSTPGVFAFSHTQSHGGALKLWSYLHALALHAVFTTDLGYISMDQHMIWNTEIDTSTPR